MKLTALEIRKHEFTRSFRGYDAEEVDAFLNMIAEHWQTTKQDTARLEERLEEQTQRINHYLKVEEALEAALDNAKTLSKDRLEAATAEADERVQSAKEEANSTLSDAESKAAEALQSAEDKAAATVLAANERANSVLADARSQLLEITELADAARRTAQADLERLESERQRLLTSLKELMEGGLASVSVFEDAVPAPEIADFEAARPLTPREALHQPVAMAAVLPAPAEPGAEPAAELDAEPAAELDADAAEVAAEAAVEPAAPKVLRLEEPDDLDAPTELDDTDSEESPVLTLSKSSHDEYLDDLPSADDVVDDSGSPASAAASATPAKDAPFAAEDEIKKIHRILEDLDN